MKYIATITYTRKEEHVGYTQSDELSFRFPCMEEMNGFLETVFDADPTKKYQCTIQRVEEGEEGEQI